MPGPPILKGPFTMPMVKDFIPRRLQPWLYVVCAVIFQMVDGIYMGSMQQMVGEWSVMREDVSFIFMCGVVGVAMPFPILFRLKFRFTNRQLELFSVSGMLICNLLALWVRWIPALCVISYVCCFLKLMATFEIMSNIQLWMTPKRDFRIFFPLLYIIVLCDMSLSSFVAKQLTYYCGSWQAMQEFIIVLLALVLVFFITCVRDFRFMKPMPFLSIDWLGALLWSIVLLQIIWLFTYGEYYNWSDGATWRHVLYALPVSAYFAIQRMRHIRHPYIDPKAFQYRTLLPILFMFAVAELMNSTPTALQNVFTGQILHYGYLTSSVFDLFVIIGNITGCLFCLWWMKMLHAPYTRLLTIGFAFLLVYQICMYFLISPVIEIHMLYFPTFIRSFGYTIFFVTLTLYLQELMPFQHFFMGLTIAGFIRNGVVDTICTGTYSYLLRYHIADNLARALPFDATQSMMMGIKQLFGATCIGGCVFLLLLMLWHVQPVHSTLKHVPYWNVVGRRMRKELEANKA